MSINPNEVPPITDPLGKHWQQPKRENILVDNTHALMSKADFEKLLDYSLSQPSGVYEGKMWKCQRLGPRYEPTGQWILRWFGVSDKPGYVSNHGRDILIYD